MFRAVFGSEFRRPARRIGHLLFEHADGVAFQDFQKRRAGISGARELLCLFKLGLGFGRLVARGDRLLHETRELLFGKVLALTVEDVMFGLPLFDAPFGVGDLRAHLVELFVKQYGCR